MSFTDVRLPCPECHDPAKAKKIPLVVEAIDDSDQSHPSGERGLFQPRLLTMEPWVVAIFQRLTCRTTGGLRREIPPRWWDGDTSVAALLPRGLGGCVARHAPEPLPF